MDTIFISELMVETTIGVYDWERQIKQKLMFDIELATDCQKAAENDDFKQALDYHGVCEVVKTFVEDTQCQLLETLAEQTAQLIQEKFATPWLRLKLSKLNVLTGVKAVGVIIERGSAS